MFSAHQAMRFLVFLGDALGLHPTCVEYTWSCETGTTIVKSVFIKHTSREKVDMDTHYARCVPLCSSPVTSLTDTNRFLLDFTLRRSDLLTVNGFSVHTWGDHIYDVLADDTLPKVFMFATAKPRWARLRCREPLTAETVKVVVADIAKMVGCCQEEDGVASLEYTVKFVRL